MWTVFTNSWALLVGMFMLMLGNGMHGTLLGVRGSIEGFSATEMSWIMSGYFLGFLFGSRMAPEMIRRVGHVRVFAALASLISAALIIFPAYPDEFVWFFLRVAIGFSFSGVYVVAESWLNDSATNETRGQTLSIYLIVQMSGIVVAQAVLNTADPDGYLLFVVISVLVSLSFAPILLSISPAPMFSTTKPMPLKTLAEASPLGVVGVFLLGGVFAALFGMAPVYGTEIGLSVADLSIFIAAIYLGGMLCQYPIGWISDHMDRRLLIIALTAGCSVLIFLTVPFLDNRYALLGLAFVIGGIANPLYSLFIAYTNDYLEHDDMAAASGGLIFANGIGAIFSPMLIGWLMDVFTPNAFFYFISTLMAVMAVFAAYRATQRGAVPVDETGLYTPVAMQTSQVTLEVAQEYAIEQALEEELELDDAHEN